MTGRLANRRVYTVAEWCALTGEKPNAVRKRLARGSLRGRKTKGRWRVAAAELSRRDWR